MILELTYYGDPILRKKAEKIRNITDDVRSLVQDMIETLQSTEDGVGLAAPQVGHSASIFVLQFPEDQEDGTWVPGKIQVFINPKILEHGREECLMEEGCLSIPGIFEDVSRPISVKVEAEDLDGRRFVEEFFGFEARMVLHEYDHLEGVLFIDRLNVKKKKMIERKIQQILRLKNRIHL